MGITVLLDEQTGLGTRRERGYRSDQRDRRSYRARDEAVESRSETRDRQRGMPAGNYDPSLSYSPIIGYLYIFNLIVGTGALALPKAFQTAGWALSFCLLCVSCLVSYIAATFILECLSIANAVHAKRKKAEEEEDEHDAYAAQQAALEDAPSIELTPQAFEITQRVEVSEMSTMFLNRFELFIAYISLNFYLFGDLAIYSSTVSKSLMNILCASINSSQLESHSPCRDSFPDFITRFFVYRCCILLFILLILPMVIAGITKTKYIQLATTVSRWTAFTLMIVLASSQLIQKGPSAHPPPANIHGFGSLFGVTVYAFMCHHSLPSIVTPMSSKKSVFHKFAGVYLLVLAFYFTLSVTGAFAFERVQDVYTLNFLHDELTSPLYFLMDHFLAFFPVFTLSTNYPIVAITLINNVRVLLHHCLPQQREDTERLVETEEGETSTAFPGRRRGAMAENSFWRVTVPIFVIGMPTIISLFSDDVLFLAAATGSFPGVGVQFLIPCMLVIKARSHMKRELVTALPLKNASPFQSGVWPLAIMGWAALSIAMTTLNLLKVNF